MVAVGTYKGLVQIWDINASSPKRVSTMEGHSARVGKHFYTFAIYVGCSASMAKMATKWIMNMLK